MRKKRYKSVRLTLILLIFVAYPILRTETVLFLFSFLPSPCFLRVYRVGEYKNQVRLG
jgi:hypothetical protein